MTDQPTAAEIAEYDQIHTSITAVIDVLIEGHHIVVAHHGREVATASLASFVATDVSGMRLAELLAVAIDRLAHQEDRHV